MTPHYRTLNSPRGDNRIVINRTCLDAWKTAVAQGNGQFWKVYRIFRSLGGRF